MGTISDAGIYLIPNVCCSRDRLCAVPQGIAVKDWDRNPAPSLSYPVARRNDFCVCRVLVGWALTTIESFDNLPAAKRYMHRIAARVPGSYVVFSQTSRQVLAKVVRQAT
jgi:hypothetical protein